MAILSNNASVGFLDAGVTSGYQIEKSLRFNEPDSAKLSRTFTAAGDQTKFTLSFWFKNCDAGATNSKMLFCLDNGGSSQLELYDGRLATQFYAPNGSDWAVILSTASTHLFKDPAAWYHIVLSIDTTAGTTNADRQKIYINGEQLTLTFDTYWGGLMTGKVKGWNTADEHFIGMRGSSYGGNWLAAEYYFIDGQALDASSFGEFHADTGQWIPKKYEGDYNYAEKLNLKGTLNDEALDVVVNRVVDKCWIKSDGNWVGGGDPSDTASAPTFHILNGEAAANLYWATTAYDQAHTITIGTSSETGTQPEWDDKSGSWTINSATEISGTFGSSYGHARTDAMTDGNVYAFTYTIDAPTGGSSGANHSGWFITDSVISSYASTVPDEQSSINSVGSRWYAASGDGGYAMDHIAVYGDFVALNITGSDSSYSGFLGGLGLNSFYLKFDGTDIGTDSSGIGNDWTANNLTVSGHVNMPCVSFDGSGDYLSIPDSADFTVGSDPFTIEFWAYKTSSGEDNMIGSSDSGGSTASLSYAIQTGSSSPSNSLCAHVGDGSSLHTCNSGVDFVLNRWVHIAFVRDGNTLRLFQNGIQMDTTAFSGTVKDSADSFFIGRGGNFSGTKDFPGYISNFHFVKGTALYTANFTPSTTATKHANTKLLCCQSSSSATEENSDSSHTITATNASATTKSDDTEGDDQLNDSPTSFDDGGNGTGNYATWNPLRSLSDFAQGNLAITSHSSGTYHTTPTTLAMTSGKWYCEMKPSATGGTNNAYGIMNDTTNTNTYLGATTGTDSSMGLWDNGGTYRNGAYTNASYCSAFQTGGEVIGLAFDVDNGTLKFYINGVDKGNAWTDIPAGTWHFCVTTYQTTTTHISLNCGQQGFAYTPPSGYKAINTYNLPDPAIANPKKHFDVITYTGDSSDTAGNKQDITGLAFEPGMIWLKKRTATTHHYLFDQLRGAKYISPSGEGAETADDGIDAWNSDGVTLEYTTGTELITNDATYVGWTWKAGTTGSISAEAYDDDVYDDSQIWSGSHGSDAAFEGDFGSTGLSVGTSAVNLTSIGFSVTSTISVWIHNPSGINVILGYNGTDYTATDPTDFGWTDFTVPSGTNSGTLTVKLADSGDECRGVKIDGKILVDSDAAEPPHVPTIASTYRADTDVGFSIVKYTGTGTTPSSVGHGLNAEPAMIWVKSLSQSPSKPWIVYHKDIGANKYLYLNRPIIPTTSALPWNNNQPNSLTWATQDWSEMNTVSEDYVAYCWSEVEGYSKFGSYTGTADDPGPFVYCGFKPAFLMIKRTDAETGTVSAVDTDWIQYDGKVQPNEISVSHSTSAPHDFMPLSETWATNDEIDLVSNGFKLRSDGPWNNDTAGSTYVFAAWAESPFKYANAK